MIAFRLLLILCLLGLGGTLRAEILIGVAQLDELTGLNLEWAGDHNSLYVMPAAERTRSGIKRKLRWAAGFRHRIEGGHTGDSGFYTGLIVGDIGGDKDYVRHGGGGELGYQWVRPGARITASAALVVLEAVPEEELKDEPAVLLGVSFALRR